MHLASKFTQRKSVLCLALQAFFSPPTPPGLDLGPFLFRASLSEMPGKVSFPLDRLLVLAAPPKVFSFPLICCRTMWEASPGLYAFLPLSDP